MDLGFSFQLWLEGPTKRFWQKGFKFLHYFEVFAPIFILWLHDQEEGHQIQYLDDTEPFAQIMEIGWWLSLE